MQGSAGALLSDLEEGAGRPMAAVSSKGQGASHSRARQISAESSSAMQARACRTGSFRWAEEEKAVGASARLLVRHSWSREEHLHQTPAAILRTMLGLGRRCPVPISGVAEHHGSLDRRHNCAWVGDHPCQCHGRSRQSLFQEPRWRHRPTLLECSWHHAPS